LYSKALEGLDIARVVALEMEKLAAQYGLKIADAALNPARPASTRSRHCALVSMAVSVIIARAIERQITDGLIDAARRRRRSRCA